MRIFTSIYVVIIFLVTFVDLALPSDDLLGGKPKNNFNIVLITIDALRADHLSCYGYDRNTSPNIDKIAQKGIIFKNAIAPSSYTVPSMASLFTSLYPTNHGVLYGRLSDIYPDDFRKFEKNINHVIPDKFTTLAEILKIHGYTTFGISSNLLLDKQTGFAKGFDYFEHPHSAPASYINKIVLSLEDEIRKSDKFFLWVHYLDPHFPYLPRDPWIERYTSKELTQKLKLSEKKYNEFLKLIPTLKKNHQALSNLIALYDSEINFVDFHVGELIQKLDLDKGTLIIITSDHGEDFWNMVSLHMEII